MLNAFRFPRRHRGSLPAPPPAAPCPDRPGLLCSAWL